MLSARHAAALCITATCGCCIVKMHKWHALKAPHGGAKSGRDPWEGWNAVRCLAGHNSRLGVVLDVPTSLPPQAEIVRCVRGA